MRTSIAATLALLGAGLCSAADLTIPANQTYTVSPMQSDLRLEHLRIGDNAQIRFAPGVSRWRVEARHVAIGSNVVIDGRGSDGAPGQRGEDRSGQAKDCDAGAAGGVGAPGGGGGNGVALVLWWGIDSLGGMKLLTDGGAGAPGGSGGHGQDGGRVNLCSGPAGGPGGPGGAGGSGGRGGDVSFSYFDASGKGLPSLRDRLSASSSGGRAAAGGAGGGGGGASEGRFQRTPVGDRWYRGGDPGPAGAAGAQGVTGANGVIDIEAVAADSSPAWAGEAGSMAPADRGTVVSLQQQVQALQVQNQALQAQSQAPTANGVEQRMQALQEQVRKLEARVQVLEAR